MEWAAARISDSVCLVPQEAGSKSALGDSVSLGDVVLGSRGAL